MVRTATIELVALLFVLGCEGVAPPPPIESDFDSGTEGWSLEGVDTEATGWPIDGWASGEVSVDGGALFRREAIFGTTEYFVAPAAYRGDLTAYRGGELSFVLWQNQREGAFAGPLLVLLGPDSALLFDGPDPGQTPTPYTVPLAPGPGWTVYGSGAAATDEDFDAVFADLRALRIRAEFSERLDEGWLDDVVLSP